MKITTNIYVSFIVAAAIVTGALIITPESSCKRRQYITDQLGITSVPVANIITPHTIEELQTIVRTSTLPISIAGACYSQGGQTGYPNGLVIDMNKLNKIVSLNKKDKTITVQAGATWYDIQQYIDRYNLSVKAMQSYNNFSIGGSISVNAHGRDVAYGSVINGIKSLEIMLANGELITADRTHNTNLFNAAIGGYGLLGIITQATIELTDNIPLQRVIRPCTINNFQDLFTTSIASDESVIFYNTDIIPKKYQQCFTTTWHTTAQPVTDTIRLQSPNASTYLIDKALEMFIRRVPLAQHTRVPFEQLKNSIVPNKIVWRNNEMSYSVNQLAIDYHYPSTMTLQEYFIPIEHAQEFAQKLTSILSKNKVNVLNISIRYVKADTTSLMTYAPQESFAFVLYFNIINTQRTINKLAPWTRKIIDAALKYNGTYYLPYIMSATKQQFHKAYPNFDELLKIKQIYDPHNKFRNTLLYNYS
jgi:FAD/FMN-containing dehydrogenase